MTKIPLSSMSQRRLFPAESYVLATVSRHMLDVTKEGVGAV